MGFLPGDHYSRKDVFDTLRIFPHPDGGPWFTGYHSYEGAHYIFCNVGTAGRTGHQYANHWETPDRLRWYGKTRSTAAQPQIKAMIQGSSPVYLFSRDHNQARFKFAGVVRALEVKGERPVEVLWEVVPATSNLAPEEVTVPESYYEGATTKISVNAYERSREARAECIQHHGCVCKVCGFDFERVFGTIGKDFIHVHHVVPLASVGERYRVDPIEHLLPVCPNCHAMLHRREPPYSIDELRQIMEWARVSLDD